MPGPRTKYTLLRGGVRGRRWGSNHPITTPPSGYYDFQFQTKDELKITQGNPYHKLGKSSGAIGGDFLVIRRELAQDAMVPERYWLSGSGLTATRYKTPFSSVGPLSVNDFPSPILLTNSQLDAAGTTAIANVIPTNPLSGLLVALGELKSDGLPLVPGIQTWKSRTLSAKNAGKEYLNKEFGWLPLLSDIRKFSNVVANSDKLIAQYERNSGKTIKRSLKFPTETTTTMSEEVGNGFNHVMPYPAIIGAWQGSNGSIKRYTTTRIIREKWFDGAFTYYLPPYRPGGDNSKRNAQIRNYLFGTRITPEALWDLTPWTWAADWVGNFGDVLHNVSAFQNDGLVMKYGYVMSRVTHESQIVYAPLRQNGLDYGSTSATLRTTTKARRTATPYGFGLNTSSFSLRQIAILLSLGISR